MNRLAVIGVLLVASTAPAQATEWLICSNGDKASISVLLGQMEVIAVADIMIEVGQKKWSTKGDGATLITKGQAFETKDQIWIDVTDANVAGIVAQLRLFKASEGDDYVSGGILRVADEGAWAVTCSGP
ncbi:MAG: hypothetical protein H7X89_10535 [Rhizobiales bacterium]|nr:hypothetical protein [Hyphomicrobiales bacterium]